MLRKNDSKPRDIRLFLVQEDFHTVVIAVDPHEKGRNALRLSFSANKQCPDEELKVILLPVHIKGIPGSHHLKRTSLVTNYLGSYRTSVRELCKRAQTARQGPYHHIKNNCRNFCSHFMDEMWDLRLEDEDLSDEPVVKTTMEEKTTAFSWMMYVLLFLFALLLFIYFASMFQGLKKNDPEMTQQIIDDSVFLTYLDRMTNLEFKI